jgi:hypothetical protein
MNSTQMCWMDESLTCCEENCQLLYNPALCNDAGEQIPESEILEQKEIQAPAAQPLFETDNSDLITAENNTEEKEEIKSMGKKAACIDCGNVRTIIGGGRCYSCWKKNKTAAGVQPRKKTRTKSNPAPPQNSVQDPVIDTLSLKLQELNKAAWSIMGALATMRELGIKFDMPELKWPE